MGYWGFVFSNVPRTFCILPPYTRLPTRNRNKSEFPVFDPVAQAKLCGSWCLKLTGKNKNLLNKVIKLHFFLFSFYYKAQYSMNSYLDIRLGRNQLLKLV